jgi:hypothetical protein
MVKQPQASTGRSANPMPFQRPLPGDIISMMARRLGVLSDFEMIEVYRIPAPKAQLRAIPGR